MDFLVAYYATLNGSANRAIVLQNSTLFQTLSGIAPGTDWKLEVRARPAEFSNAYFVNFNSNTYLDAFGITFGYGGGGYAFLAHTADESINIFRAITTNETSVFRTIGVQCQAGQLTAYADGVAQWSATIGALTDPLIGMNLGARGGGGGGGLFSGAVDYLFLEIAGVRVLDYSFNEDAGPASNSGSLGGAIANPYGEIEREDL